MPEEPVKLEETLDANPCEPPKGRGSRMVMAACLAAGMLLIGAAILAVMSCHSRAGNPKFKCHDHRAKYYDTDGRIVTDESGISDGYVLIPALGDAGSAGLGHYVRIERGWPVERCKGVPQAIRDRTREQPSRLGAEEVPGEPAGRPPFKPATGGPLRLQVLPAEAGIRLEFTNASDQPLRIITKLDPTFGVARLTAVDSNGRQYEVESGRDWLVFAQDVFTLGPGVKLTRKTPLTSFKLRPGVYRVQASYTVDRDNFFVEPWLKDMLTDRGPKFQRTKKLMESLWFGTAVSPVAEIEIKGLGEPDPPTEPDF